jgi:hypothetical protein
MKWYKAKSKIESNIRFGTDLNTAQSHYRFVIIVDKHGFIVSIGNSNSIKILWVMPEQCVQAFISNKGYNSDYFRQHFPVKAYRHLCHIHATGQIFVASDLAILTTVCKS